MKKVDAEYFIFFIGFEIFLLLFISKNGNNTAVNKVSPWLQKTIFPIFEKQS